MGRELRIPSWASIPRRSGIYTLVVAKEDGEETVNIDERAGYLIGRSKKECDIVCDDKTCSRVHCCIAHHERGKIYLVDLDSVHGVFVDGVELESGSQTELRPGKTRFRLGSCPWTFSLVREAGSERPESSGRRERPREHAREEARPRHPEADDDGPPRERESGSREDRDRDRGRSRGDSRKRHSRDVEPWDADRSRKAHHRSDRHRHEEHRGEEDRRRREDDWRDPGGGRASRGSNFADRDPADVVMSMGGGGRGMGAQQKKKLLWGNKAAAPADSEGGDAVFGANRWDAATFSSDADKQKFIKLMGVKGGGAAAGPGAGGGEAEREVLTGDRQAKLLSDVEGHFMQGLRRADGRKVGLGL